MGKKTQAIYKALLARPVYSFLTEIQVTCLARNPISTQIQISNLRSHTRGKTQISSKCTQSKTDLNNENPCHASSSNEQFKVLHCPLCGQQIKKSLSVDPSKYMGGNSILIGLMNRFKQLLSNISNNPQTCKRCRDLQRNKVQ